MRTLQKGGSFALGGIGLRWVSLGLLMFIARPAFAQSDPELDAVNSRVVQFYSAGRFAEGLPVAAAAVALAEQMRGPLDPSLATALNNYGQYLVRANRLAEAEVAYRRALHIDETAPAGGRSLARDLNNLAELMQLAGRASEAEQLYVRALAIDEQILGPSHRDVARDLNNIAALRLSEGKNDGAEPLQRRAIAILDDLQRENPSRSTSDLASALSNYAAVLPAERLEEAQLLYRRALELNERDLGPEHPNVAISLNNLAEALRLSGKNEEAESLFRRALRIDERVLGPQSPTVATVVNNLAKVLRDTNRRAEAQSLFNRALSIDQASFGPMHLSVARDLKNLAKFYKVASRSGEAEPLMRRVVDILQETERTTGRPVIEIGPALNFQAQILADTKRFVEAEDCYRKALSLDEKNYGQHSLQVSKDLKDLAQLLKATNRSEEAVSLLHRADEITAMVKRPRSANDQPCPNLACEAGASKGI